MRFRKASLLTKIVILALLVCATVTLVHLQKQINEVNAENALLSKQENDTKQENEKLKAAVEGIQTYVEEVDSKLEAAGEDANKAEIVASVDSDAMEELAREQGNVDSNEIVFVDNNK